MAIQRKIMHQKYIYIYIFMCMGHCELAAICCCCCSCIKISRWKDVSANSCADWIRAAKILHRREREKTGSVRFLVYTTLHFLFHSKSLPKCVQYLWIKWEKQKTVYYLGIRFCAVIWYVLCTKKRHNIAFLHVWMIHFANNVMFPLVNFMCHFNQD